ncbi:LysR family transcriptional regulator [Sphingomonas sp. SRS2]|uniref:LysR family transcriptional regulator n=1 Tax=Sphingomonas sp. SRS2 TaxID=133190 RepID=UPI000AB22789|nr:LysR family transcriptional regulator [Sphingomonas sp. SRS2]
MAPESGSKYPDLRLISAFVEVAQERSFTKAAARLQLSQPRLSMRIRALEEQLGFSLLSRNSRNVSLSVEGAALLPAAKQMIEMAERVLATASEINCAYSSRLEIGAVSFRVPERWTILSTFLSAHPNISVTVQTAASTPLWERLREHVVNIAFTLGPVPADLQSMVLSKCRIGLSVPQSSPWAVHDRISLNDLRGQSVVLFPRVPDIELHDRVRAKLAPYELQILDFPEMSSEAMTQFVAQAKIATISAQWWERDHSADLHFLTIDEIEDEMELHLVTTPGPMSDAVAKLWTMLSHPRSERLDAA